MNTLLKSFKQHKNECGQVIKGKKQINLVGSARTGSKIIEVIWMVGTRSKILQFLLVLISPLLESEIFLKKFAQG